ncbi:transmembrane protein 198 isoform X1 [Bubalus bubalis]|uniref:transmembrane protein 198 isoform X1 n=1 Tax=Bubalus bubalis TaxID=89462 RepID=UPI001D0F69D0|nr:transmembrane protein 198 isoform X1 [Bubalus bubalis]
MGPRLWGSPSPCSCFFPFPRPSLSPRTSRDWSASRCWRRSGVAAAQGPVPPAQQPPSPHRGLLPDPSQLEALAPGDRGPSGPCTASFAQKLRSPPAQLLPPEPDDAFWGAPCEQPLERRYEALPALVCIMCCLFGVVYCFFGYRCFKAVLFLTGLLFGSVVIFLLCYRERVLETQLSAGASAGIALGIGLLCGLVAMLVRSVGLFLVGLLLGLLLAAAALLGSAPYYQPGSVWGPLGLLLGGGLLCALLTLRWPRPLTTLATAVTGAALIATAADYFAELLLLARYAVERLRAAPVPPLCWRSWALLALWPLLSLMGVLVQWRVTAERDSHTEVVISRQRRRVQLMRIRQQEERKEKRRKKRPPRALPRGSRAPPRPGPPDPAYRRRPVPIKRFNGDILSPSYIQSFRDRQTGSSLSSFMASPTDADYEYGSRGPLTACSGPPVRV